MTTERIRKLWRWYWNDARWWGFQALINVGLMKQDITLPESEACWYWNFRWQWRFWRGPYYERAIQLGLKPPRWRDTAFWWRRRWR